MENETNIETLSEEDNEYAQFVKSLLDHNPSDGNIAAWDTLVDDDDDEEEYQADDDDEEEEDETECMDGDSTTDAASIKSFPSLDGFPLDPLALEEELGSLLEEDMEAAINSLIMKDADHDMGGGGMSKTGHLNDSSPIPPYNPSPGRVSLKDDQDIKPSSNTDRSTTASETVPSNPQRKSPAPMHAQPTNAQILKLQQLMSNHYQILLQQAVLACRAAHSNRFKAVKRKRVPDFFFGGETADDLKEIVDGTVTMLQDLDRNRKDAMRFFIQMSRAKKQKVDQSSMQEGFYPISAPNALSPEVSSQALHGFAKHEEQRGWLTRSAFIRTLRETDGALEGTTAVNENPVHLQAHLVTNANPALQNQNSNSMLGVNTTFGVRGLARLNETFQAIDNSLSRQNNTTSALDQLCNAAACSLTTKSPQTAIDVNIFLEGDHGTACEVLLQHAKADYNKDLIPGYKELSHILTYPYEVMGEETGMPMSEDQQKSLRMNKSQFTAAEDNLLLRGVNLYGEKEWLLISDRFLPDRTISQISQRYWRLCLLIYKSNGIFIDNKGNFLEPPRAINGPEDFDENKVRSIMRPVKKPDVIGLYRWSMEEDLCLLKAVPLMGRFFAEIGKRFIPYRDRGALRKRYQVLERRVKGAVKRDKKLLADLIKKNKSSKSTNKNKRSEANTNARPQTAPPVIASSNAEGMIIGTRYIPLNNSKLGKPVFGAVRAGRFQNQHFSQGIVSKKTSAPATNRLLGNSIPMMNFPKSKPNFTQSYQPSTTIPNSYTMPRLFPKSTGIFGAPTGSQISAAAPKDTSSSRAEFEKIIEGEWSQMSGVGKIIDEGTTQHASPPAKGSPTLLPPMNYGENSLSGLSALVDDSKLPPIAATNSVKRGGNIMASVLKRANEGSATGQNALNEVERVDFNANSQFSAGFGMPLPSDPSRLGYNQSFTHSLMDNTDMDAAVALNKMMAPHDLEAVSALSQLSASKDHLQDTDLHDTSFAVPLDIKDASLIMPSSPFQPPPPRNTHNRIEKKDDHNTGSGARRTLFEKVVGSKQK